jgi:NAD(P)-dependent dehydrogenase (short-subunit alcohol dehydrogenase family)
MIAQHSIMQNSHTAFAPSYQFLKCDVCIWAEQLAVFKAAKKYSPHKSIDIVVANAGIAGYDHVSHMGRNLSSTQG